MRRLRLDFHPLARRRHHGGVQRLVAIGLGQADPIAQTVRVRLVEIRDHAVRPPDVCLLVRLVGVQDDPNREHVIDLLEADLLGLHLVPNAEHALGATHDLVVQPSLIKLCRIGTVNVLMKRVRTALVLRSRVLISP